MDVQVSLLLAKMPVPSEELTAAFLDFKALRQSLHQDPEKPKAPVGPSKLICRSATSLVSMGMVAIKVFSTLPMQLHGTCRYLNIGTLVSGRKASGSPIEIRSKGFRDLPRPQV